MMPVNFQPKPKTYVVLNPVAGLSQLEAVREKIQSALRAREIPFEIYETTGKDDLGKHIRERVQQGYELFIAAGGDGTLSGVLDGVAGTRMPLAIIPTGTWNALARALDIPLQMDQAIDLLFHEHEIRTIDAMQVGEKFYVLSVSVGLAARTMQIVEREEKRRLGKLADLWKGWIRLLEFRSYLFDVKIDGKMNKFRASELLVANVSNLSLKSLQLDPSIHMDDGKLNVCRIYANTMTDYFKLAASMLRGGQHNWNTLCVEASQEVEIRCRESLPVQGDGDLIGRLPVTVTVRPKAIHVVVPIKKA